MVGQVPGVLIVQVVIIHLESIKDEVVDIVIFCHLDHQIDFAGDIAFGEDELYWSNSILAGWRLSLVKVLPALL